MDSFSVSEEKLIDVQFIEGRIPYERKHKGLDVVVSRNLVQLLFPDQLSLGNLFEITFELTDEE